MNLFIKFVETRKPKEEIQKTVLEAADISLELLKDTLIVINDQNKKLISSNDTKDAIILELTIKIKSLDMNIEKLEKEVRVLVEETGRLNVIITELHSDIKHLNASLVREKDKAT
jgi:hypothetical protein